MQRSVAGVGNTNHPTRRTIFRLSCVRSPTFAAADHSFFLYLLLTARIESPYHLKQDMSFAFGGGGPLNAPSENDSQEPKIEPSTPYVAAGDGALALLRKSLQILNLQPNAADSNGFTFVHAAAAYCRLEVMRWLFEQDCVDVNARDADGDTPLHHCDERDAARLLIEEGKADYAIRNEEGKTAREAKEEELKEEAEDDEDDSDDEDRQKLQELVAYLKSLENESECQDEVMR